MPPVTRTPLMPLPTDPPGAHVAFAPSLGEAPDQRVLTAELIATSEAQWTTTVAEMRRLINEGHLAPTFQIDNPTLAAADADAEAAYHARFGAARAGLAGPSRIAISSPTTPIPTMT